MKKKKDGTITVSSKEAQLIERLRENPKMMERVETIMSIVENKEGPIKTADEVEGLLIEEMRLLGNTTLTEWAAHVEERGSREQREKDPTLRSRKKKL